MARNVAGADRAPIMDACRTAKSRNNLSFATDHARRHPWSANDPYMRYVLDMTPSDPHRTADLLRDAAARSQRYLDSLATRPVGPRPEGVAGAQRFDEPMPAEPRDPMETL